ncbi:MAG: hypothetical protein HETSPECPRED_007018 [Heterodermia speciosa]|uniref:Peptidase C15, pyroglutamyl peptidase I-like protein n=1 Tax=Heterodermia speciosa TaxID=116794 RepID=A0A8H3EQA5_9LECA|nr:MAG: hypothetical protein HETSPECPRED_007018 [Heterodermia speciosa]
MEDDTLWREDYRAPATLHTSYDTEDVWRRWKGGLTDEDLRPSDDPGRYLCDFTYYSSMVEYWRRDHKSTRPVMFLHVPGGTTDQDIARGKKVALGLIEALVASKQELSAKQDLSA